MSAIANLQNLQSLPKTVRNCYIVSIGEPSIAQAVWVFSAPGKLEYVNSQKLLEYLFQLKELEDEVSELKDLVKKMSTCSPDYGVRRRMIKRFIKLFWANVNFVRCVGEAKFFRFANISQVTTGTLRAKFSKISQLNSKEITHGSIRAAGLEW